MLEFYNLETAKVTRINSAKVAMIWENAELNYWASGCLKHSGETIFDDVVISIF